MGVHGFPDVSFPKVTIAAVFNRKTQGAWATDPGKDQGEANAPFGGDKVSLFISAVNGELSTCGDYSACAIMLSHEEKNRSDETGTGICRNDE